MIGAPQQQTTQAEIANSIASIHAADLLASPRALGEHEKHVKRSDLIQGVVWLSRHIPGCVLKFLIDSIHDARKKATEADGFNKTSSKIDKLMNMANYTAIILNNEPPVPSSIGVGLKNSVSSQPAGAITTIFPTKGDEDIRTLPIVKSHEAALLFVDISGFTKTSTMLDVESLSDAINSYYEKIVNQITSHGGDILNFAGDALFAEWRVDPSRRSSDSETCVATAAACAANIVKQCSNFPIFGKKKRSSVLSRSSTGDSSLNSVLSHPETELNLFQQPISEAPRERRFQRASSTLRLDRRVSKALATLNVKCGLGVGKIVDIHLGENFSRKKYAILGDPIDQATNAERHASLGEVFASPEAMECLAKTCEIQVDWKSYAEEKEPTPIATFENRFFRSKSRVLSGDCPEADSNNIAPLCEKLAGDELQWLKKMISDYVHPVVVNDDGENTMQMKRRESEKEWYLAEAELRNVYVMFITPLINRKLTGDAGKDQHLFRLLNDIHNVTNRELSKVHGQLLQFIVDDKGVVLIGAFGLRGSTFPNMISQRALPVTLSIHEALIDELGVDNRIGGTLGRVYCGVVGGSKRHEYTVLGPSVNLSARLMASKSNPGVLVDENVRMLASRFFFKSLPPVIAKGYDDRVPIFEPIEGNETRWRHVKKNFVGRTNEIKQVMHAAKKIALGVSQSKFVFVSAASGMGKSSMMVQAAERVRAMLKKMKRRVVVTHSISNEGDSRVPFHLFRSILKDLILKEVLDGDQSKREYMEGGTETRGSNDFSIDDQWDELSLQTHSTHESTIPDDAANFRCLCKELNAPPECFDIVGKSLLGIRDKSTDQLAATTGGTLNMNKIVDFMADAFVRCTRHAHLVILACDDAHWMDEMSWKVVQAIFERGKNTLILCGSRPPSSNPLSVDPTFWSSLHGEYKEDEQFLSIELTPFDLLETKEMIASTLDINPSKIEHNFAHNIFSTSGGMPHFMSYVLDCIKRNDLTVRLANGVIGLKGTAGNGKLEFGSVDELLLHRLDALDASVRGVLHLAAVMGTEFDLLDAALAYEGMLGVSKRGQCEAAVVLQCALNEAVTEGIIQESFAGGQSNADEYFDEDDAHLNGLAENYLRPSRGRDLHPLQSDNRRYRFTHDSWRTSILSCMLRERKSDLHEHIALALEREFTSEPQNQDDIEKQIRIFDHWSSSGNFVRSADLSLKIGGQLMMLGLNKQSILLFNDTMAILNEQGEDDCHESYGGICCSVLDSINVPELERLMTLKIARGKAYSTLGESIKSAVCFQNALDILHNTPCADDPEFNRSLTFPIFSGLFVTMKMGAIEQDKECTYEKDLIKKFIEQTRLHGDPVHYGRALAMQAETFGRLGNFDQALESLEQVKSIYNIEEHHAATCKAYGSDRTAQAYSHSIHWDKARGRLDDALERCKFIVSSLLPKCDPKNVHNSFCLSYSSVMTMKDNGMAFEARDVFLKHVMEPFEEYFGPGGSTFAKPLFKPLLVLLDLQGNEGKDVEKLDEYMKYISEDSNVSIPESVEIGVAGHAAHPSVIFGEICYYLAKRVDDNDERRRLIRRGLRLIERSLEKTKSLPSIHFYSEGKMEEMIALAKESDCLDGCFS